jgi:hypothetical protein
MRKEAAEVRREQAAQFSQLLSLLASHHVSSNTPPAHQTHTMDTTPAWGTPTRQSMDTDSEDNHQDQPDRKSTPRYTASEWANRHSQAQVEADSSGSSSDTSSDEYDVFNRQGRRIDELTIEEQAYYAAESATEAAAAAIAAITNAETTAATATTAADAVTKAARRETSPQEHTPLTQANTAAGNEDNHTNRIENNTPVEIAYT